MLANIVEIKETAQRFFLERDCPDLVEKLDMLKESSDPDAYLEQRLQCD